jgi:hypothetical protein
MPRRSNEPRRANRPRRPNEPEHPNEFKHPNELKHLNVDKCSLPSIVSHRPSSLESDHGIRFINGPLIRTCGNLLVKHPPRNPPLEFIL